MSVPVETPIEVSSLLVPVPHTVVGKRLEAPDTWTLDLAPVEGTLPDFLPAQVSMLGAFGVGEAAISISSAVSVQTHHSYTIRRVGPITSALVDTPVGGVVTVRGPFGQAWPLDRITTSGLLIVAGGLGLAPLRAAVEAVVEQSRSNRYNRVDVVMGARTPADVVYGDDLDRWGRSDAEVLVTVDEADDTWTGPTGLVTEHLGSETGVQLDWAGTSALVCGPDAMMHFTAQRLIALGMPAQQIWITLERNMQCGNALCGHCQLGPVIICRDGPVVNYADIEPFHWIPEM